MPQRIVLTSSPAHLLASSPVHSRLKSLHRVQVDVPIVTPDCEHSPHDGGHPDSPARGGQLGHVLPAVQPWVKALHGAQGGIVIEAAFREKIRERTTNVW